MALKLNDNALIDLNTFIILIGENTDENGFNEEQVNLAINMVSESIENYCNRKFRLTTGLVEMFDGDGEKDLYTRNIPIVETVTAIKLENWDGSTWDERTIAEATRAVIADIGRVYFTDGTKFTYGEDNWRITYDYGVTLPNVPGGLKQACATLVQRLLAKAEGKEGLTSESISDRSFSYSLAGIPDDIREILDKNSDKNV